MFNKKMKEFRIRKKEKEITQVKKQLHTKIDKNMEKIDELNKHLGNGVTLKIFLATGGKHGGH